MSNRHGLSRDIPEPIKRQVRQNCGFGCVVCGASIIEYEHVDPEFADATEHDAVKITLLCPQCHTKVTTGMWSKEKIKEAQSNPKCKQTGFSNEIFDLKSHPTLLFGGIICTKCYIPIMVKGTPLFHFAAGEEPGAPFRLSETFCDSDGALSLEIKDNEWFALSSNWDVEISGRTITVRDAPRHISLKLTAHPPDSLIVEKLDMLLSGYHFIADEGVLSCGRVGTKLMEYRLTSELMSHCYIGLQLN